MKSQRGVAEKISYIVEEDIKKGLGQGLGVVVSQKMVDKIANLLGEVALDAHEQGKKRTALRTTDSDTKCTYIYREGGWLLGWYIPTARGFHVVVPGLAVQPLDEYQTEAEAEKAIRAVDRKQLV